MCDCAKNLLEVWPGPRLAAVGLNVCTSLVNELSSSLCRSCQEAQSEQEKETKTDDGHLSFIQETI